MTFIRAASSFVSVLMLAAVALVAAFDRQKVTHGVVLCVLVGVMMLTGVLWMGIRGEYRPLVPAWLVGLSVASGVAWLLTGDWIASIALWVLWAG